MGSNQQWRNAPPFIAKRCRTYACIVWTSWRDGVGEQSGNGYVPEIIKYGTTTIMDGSIYSENGSARANWLGGILKKVSWWCMFERGSSWEQSPARRDKIVILEEKKEGLREVRLTSHNEWEKVDRLGVTVTPVQCFLLSSHHQCIILVSDSD
jgi:hypothetical protein